MATKSTALVRSLLACAVTGLLATPAAAHAPPGTVWRVGPTQPITQIQTAISLAANGDVIVVDPGSYSAISVIGKGVSIVPSGGTYTLTQMPGAPGILVQGLSSAQSVSIVGAALSYSDPDDPAVRVLNNSGAVVFIDLEVDLASNLPNANTQAAVEVTNTNTFWISDSRIWSNTARSGSTVNPATAGGETNDGLSALQMTDSDGVLQDTDCRGYDNPEGYGGDGLRAIGNSSVWLRSDSLGISSVTLDGGDGDHGGHAAHLIRSPATPNLITMCPAASLHLGSGTTESGGYYGINNNPGITQSGMATVYRVPTVCSGGMLSVTSVVSPTTPPGGTISVRIRTVQPLSYATYISNSTLYSRSILSFAGRAMLNPGAPIFVNVSSGIAQPGPATTFGIPLPNLPVLNGFKFTLQTATVPTTGPASLALSSPAHVVIAP